MRSHVWRPLFIAVALIVLALAARIFLVPNDFGIHEQGYMYGWHRKGNENEWKAVTVKYKTVSYCKECHADKVKSLSRTPHGIIACENCHGPALNHPEDPPTLTVDKSRELCLRCHAAIATPTSGRADIAGINPQTHHPEAECNMCHDPHNPISRSHRDEQARLSQK